MATGAPSDIRFESGTLAIDGTDIGEVSDLEIVIEERTDYESAEDNNGGPVLMLEGSYIITASFKLRGFDSDAASEYKKTFSQSVAGRLKTSKSLVFTPRGSANNLAWTLSDARLWRRRSVLRFSPSAEFVQEVVAVSVTDAPTDTLYAIDIQA